MDLRSFRNAGTKGGTVIIKMTDDSGTSYRLVRVAESSVTVTNVSAPGEPLMPGDSVKLSFDGLYRSVNKISGVFNPTTYKLRYSTGEMEVDGTLGQYQQMDRSAITLTIPEDVELDDEGKGSYTFTNGYVFGSMYSAADPFSTMYQLTDSGVGTNFNAVTVNFCLHRLADVVIEVEERVTFNLKIETVDGENAVEGTTLVLKNASNAALTPNAQGIYEALPYGDYDYEISKAGYRCAYGTIHLGAADVETAVEGQVTRTVALTRSSVNGWDGVTVTEPETDEEGVYQIGTGAELAWFAQAVNGGQTKISAVLTNDIDLADYNWTPIGNSSKKFAGTFDGGNHTVSHIAIRKNGTTKANYMGLFGYVAGTTSSPAEICNMTVSGTMTFATASNAGIVGSASYATIHNVHADLAISATTKMEYVGGVLGNGAQGVRVENCSNAGSISGYQFVGGVVGNISHKTGTITGCVNTGSVSGSYWKIGGVAGQSSGAVTCCYNTGTVSGVNGAGGIVGYAAGTGAEVCNAFNLGTVTGGGIIGALVGEFNNASGTAARLYYLTGTCKAAIGRLPTGGTQSGEMVTAEALTATALVEKLNEGLETDVFTRGMAHPLLLWQMVPGDLNGDGNVNMEDVTILLTAINGGEMPNGMDVNGDGNVNMEDAMRILAIINQSNAE